MGSRNILQIFLPHNFIYESTEKDLWVCLRWARQHGCQAPEEGSRMNCHFTDTYIKDSLNKDTNVGRIRDLRQKTVSDVVFGCHVYKPRLFIESPSRASPSDTRWNYARPTSGPMTQYAAPSKNRISLNITSGFLSCHNLDLSPGDHICAFGETVGAPVRQRWQQLLGWKWWAWRRNKMAAEVIKCLLITTGTNTTGRKPSAAGPSTSGCGQQKKLSNLVVDARKATPEDRFALQCPASEKSDDPAVFFSAALLSCWLLTQIIIQLGR